MLVKLLRPLATAHATAVLDLEDGLWDVTSHERTRERKSWGRRALAALCAERPELFHQQRIGIRVNRMDSAEFTLDLAALKVASRAGPLACVILPKVESPADLDDCHASLARAGIKYDQLVPIIETRRGLANLTGIVTGACERGVCWVVYGHYDYSLDSLQWPFLDHDESNFWEHVTPIIQRIEHAGLQYIHPPLFQMYDDSRLQLIVEQLAARCRHEFGILTVGSRQSRRCIEPIAPEAGRAMLRPSAPRSAAETRTLAEQTVASYQTWRRADFGFAVDARSGRFISPHEYLAAVRYLGSET